MAALTATSTAQAGARTVVTWGMLIGVATAATPLAFRWLPAATVYAMGPALIAAVYIGFAVADGRWHIVTVESSVAASLVVLAAIAVTGSAWLLVAGLAAHGLKDLWQHRTQYAVWRSAGSGRVTLRS